MYARRKDMQKEPDKAIEEFILKHFSETTPTAGIFFHKGKWYAPKFGRETLEILIENLGILLEKK